MAKAALAIDPEAPVKVKLTGDLADDIARVVAIRTARPHAWIGVDANQGYDIETLAELLPVLVSTRVAQLEQPLRRGREADLDGSKRPLPFVADESALSLADTASLVGRFDVVNIKLDKCGGLTEGLAIARQAKKLGLDVMVGNMMGTSLVDGAVLSRRPALRHRRPRRPDLPCARSRSAGRISRRHDSLSRRNLGLMPMTCPEWVDNSSD